MAPTKGHFYINRRIFEQEGQHVNYKVFYSTIGNSFEHLGGIYYRLHELTPKFEIIKVVFMIFGMFSIFSYTVENPFHIRVVLIENLKNVSTCTTSGNKPGKGYYACSKSSSLIVNEVCKRTRRFLA